MPKSSTVERWELAGPFYEYVLVASRTSEPIPANPTADPLCGEFSRTFRRRGGSPT